MLDTIWLYHDVISRFVAPTSCENKCFRNKRQKVYFSGVPNLAFNNVDALTGC